MEDFDCEAVGVCRFAPRTHGEAGGEQGLLKPPLPPSAGPNKLSHGPTSPGERGSRTQLLAFVSKFRENVATCGPSRSVCGCFCLTAVAG